MRRANLTKTVCAVCVSTVFFASSFLSADCRENWPHECRNGDNSDGSCIQNGTVFASFRNPNSQNIVPGGNITFTQTEVNVGDGIKYAAKTAEFVVEKAGTYSIDAGTAGTALIFTFGDESGVESPIGIDIVVYDLCGNPSVKERMLSGASTNVITKLNKGDRLRLQTQPSTGANLYKLERVIGDPFGIGTTTQYYTDTSYATFVRMK